MELFVIDGIERVERCSEMIKKQPKPIQNTVVSAYKDNCSFSEGPAAEHLLPPRQISRTIFRLLTSKRFSLKAETHNFPYGRTFQRSS